MLLRPLVVFQDEVLKRSPVSALLPSSAAGEEVPLAESWVGRCGLKAGKRGKLLGLSRKRRLKGAAGVKVPR